MTGNEMRQMGITPDGVGVATDRQLIERVYDFCGCRFTDHEKSTVHRKLRLIFTDGGDVRSITTNSHHNPKSK